MVRRSAGILLFMLYLLQPSAWGQTTLAWKFKPGERFFVETVNKQNQTVEAAGLPKQTQELTITTVNGFTVKSSGQDGAAVELQILSLDIKSTPALAIDPNLLAGLKGLTFTLTINPAGKITRMEGFDDVLKTAVPKGNLGTIQMMRTVFNEESMRQALAETFMFLPEKPVKKGDSWENTINVGLGPMGALDARNAYADEGPGDGGEKISVKQSISYSVPKGTVSLPFKITRADFKSTDGTGTILFNVEAGKLVRSESNVKMKGTITIEAASREVVTQLSLEQIVTVRLLDKEPGK